MDNTSQDRMDEPEKRHLNTEYIPTKCRVTKPPPPKPATNPLQFVKISTCPLTKKAQEQIKKVEQIKTVKKEVREEAEDWQANLDNWKSSRRKRQEHIIERVVEVKKFEQEEQYRGRRKSKTFSEMIGDRSKGRHKYAIPIYDEDANDLSDYGIGSSSSKTNSIKDADTDDSSSILDEKDNNVYESSNKDTSSASNQSQSQSEDEMQINKTCEYNSKIKEPSRKSNYAANLYSKNIQVKNSYNSSYPIKSSPEKKLMKFNVEVKEEPQQQYTYEGAIQSYRSRIKSKINIDESIFNKSEGISKSKEVNEAQNLLPKGNLFKKKEIFEAEKTVEIGHLESPTTRRLSEELVNSQSIKDRMKSLEQFTEQPLKTADKYEVSIISLKERLQNFKSKNDNDTQNNNFKPLRESVSHNNINKISNYLLDKSKSHSSIDTTDIKNDWRPKDEIPDRCSSPETELYMNKLNMFNRDLDIIYGKSTRNIDNDSNFIPDPNYAISVSSNDLLAVSSDREDSGIHTADVSCSVSQADEQSEETELSSNTIPKCIEKLKINGTEEVRNEEEKPTTKKLDHLINTTLDFINSEKKHSDINFVIMQPNKPQPEEIVEKEVKNCELINPQNQPVPEYSEPRIYENIEIMTEFIPTDLFGNPLFSLAPPKHIQPPKEKPPPPPPPVDDVEKPDINTKHYNTTRRLKKEIHIKRSSFLGLDEPHDDPLYSDLMIDKSSYMRNFYQKDSNLEKSLYKKLQGSREGGLSEVESQDSGLEIERGRLSSDTWCSSLIDSSTPVHNRQDSGQTNSFTSEEDEIMKKEREIIETVEKEEKSRDGVFLNQNCITTSPTYQNNSYISDNHHENNLGSEKFANPYMPQRSNYANKVEEQDSEVLKVEHELLQLEKEELERKRDSMIFRENQAKARQQSRFSLDNICNNVDNYSKYNTDYRKSMPELPNDIRKSMPEVPNYVPPPNHYNLIYRKSMPDIQRAYNKSISEYRNMPENNLLMIDHQKSLPELQHDVHRNNFRSSHVTATTKQPILPGKPLRPLKDQRDNKDRLLMMKPIEPDSSHIYNQKVRSLSGSNIHMLAATPKPRNLDNWLQPKANPEIKSYSQHWLIQEAELRRLSEQKSPQKNWHSNRQEKHIPEPIIQTLTQRVQNRASLSERNQRDLRHEQSPSKKDFVQHPQTVGHALPVSYPPNVNMEESQDKVLSVSGKKKCSYCNNELGRGAAMIIESLCLFYHMECFKCCVCHTQLGDGFMGTDVRVRNQKLHCHNCYSSDDGVKFSCV